MEKYTTIDKEVNCLKKDKCLSRYLASLIMCFFFVSFVSGVNELIPFSTGIINTILKICLSIYLLYIFTKYFRKMKKRILLFVVISLFIALLNLLIFSETREFFLATAYYFFSMCLPIVIIISNISNYKVLYNSLKIVSKIIVLFNVILLLMIFFRVVKSFNNGDYSLPFGYSLIVPTIIAVDQFIKYKRIADAMSLLVLIGSIILLASRGPLLCLFLFIIYIEIKKMMNGRKYVLLMLGGSILIILAIMFKKLAVVLYTFFSGFGFQNRTLYLLTQTGIYTSGRENFYQPIIEAIIDQPLSIRGISSEYGVIGNVCHNMLLEIIYQFGVFLGGSILLLILYLVLKMFKVYNGTYLDKLCVIFFFVSFPALMVSSSLWISYPFWTWLALVLFGRNLRMTEKCV